MSVVLDCKNTLIGNYALYLDGPIPSLFHENLNTMLVIVDNDGDDCKYAHFRLEKNQKTKEVIFKTRRECMHKLIFNKEDLSIKCEFERYKENKCPDSLNFSEDEFEELFEAIPKFMKTCGCEFDTVEKDGFLELIFK